MSNRSKDRTANEGQLSLLAPLLEGSLADLPLKLRASLVAAIKQCPLSRYQIAAQVSELMGRDLTKDNCPGSNPDPQPTFPTRS